MPGALYLHVPFCPAICPYCDFHKMRRRGPLVDAYLARLEEEAERLHARFPGPLDTVYLGGGTPSHLSDDELGRIVRLFERTWGWPARLETTLEADPLTFDRARLRVFRSLGFDRLSIGLQSTQDAVLGFLGRLHDGRAGLEAVTMALEEGFNASADLITAVPGQDAARDLRALAATGVPHVSVYTLTVEPFTPFALRGVRVDEDRAADDYELAERVLRRYGLERYEVSNHARPGSTSRHNERYWHGEYFLALGPSAAAFLPAEAAPANDGLMGVRTVNPPIKGWLAGEAAERLPVDAEAYLLERLLTGLRTARGVPLDELEARTGLAPEARFGELIDAARRGGLLELDGRVLRATPAGTLQLDGLMRRFYRT